VNAEAVVDEINARYSTAYVLNRLIGGQAQRGWEIRNADGQPFVLKFNGHPGWRQQVQRFALIAAHLRRHAYPVSRILLQGSLPSDTYFFVQEVLPGIRLDNHSDDPISSEALELMLDLLDRHAGLAPNVTQRWSDYVHDATFGRQHEWRALAESQHPAIENVLEQAARRLVPLADAGFVRNDFVTGDLGPHNTLVTDGVITGVVDLEASGSGDRVIDLVLLLKWVDTEAQVERIFDIARSMGRARQFEVAETYWLLNELNGALASGDDHIIEQRAQLVRERLTRSVAW
jgi:aminoglycoside phosphotransferase (APT) family kinase protein